MKVELRHNGNRLLLILIGHAVYIKGTQTDDIILAVLQLTALRIAGCHV